MPRQKGSKNKVTQEVKERLVNLIDECINSIGVEELSIDQKLKLLQLSLHYEVPKLRGIIDKKEEVAEQPLFIEVYDSDKETDEFVVTDTYERTIPRV